MRRRPNRGEDYDEVLRQQEEFLKNNPPGNLKLQNMLFTPTLSGFELSNYVTIMNQNWLFSRLSANIFYHPYFIEEHECQFSLFSRKFVKTIFVKKSSFDNRNKCHLKSIA